MLQVKNVSKKYVTGDFVQLALNDVSLTLRDNEFVAILGPSGSGKTTLLNVIGGLDRYDSGDLIINGVSTKQYKDRDWDAYRNHTIGFVFQSYNLIPHQSVLANVELALTIGNASGNRRKRAQEALEKVGLGDQGHKRPNQLSGGQMQRVAIARALVNNPDIILADEPTGALDSKTSVQIMDLLKEVASDRLVVMVTHNPELANEYANRIIELKDGQIVTDSNPVAMSEMITSDKKPPRSSLGFLAALSLSLNNLMTKKGRTFLTAFAGAIGIIGIAMILSLSNGVNDYIKDQEALILGNYPVELTQQTIDTTSMMEKRRERLEKLEEEKEDTSEEIISSQIVADTVKTTDELIKSNDLAKFKIHLDDNVEQINDYIMAIEYSYDMQPIAYRKDKKEGLVKVSPTSLMENGQMNSMYSGTVLASLMTSSISSQWSQLVGSPTLINRNYTVVAGQWPEKANEVALIVDENNEISDYVLYNLGLLDISKMNKMIKAIEKGKKFDDPKKSFKYKDALGLKYKVFAPAELYTKKEGVYIDRSDDDKYVKKHLKEGFEVTITCVLRGNKDANVAPGVGYNMELVKYLMKQTKNSPVIKAQVRDKNINVLTGKKFKKKKKKKKNKNKKKKATAYVPQTNGQTILQSYDSPLLTASVLHTPQFVLNENEIDEGDTTENDPPADPGDTPGDEPSDTPVAGGTTIILPDGSMITLPPSITIPEGLADMTPEEQVNALIKAVQEATGLSDEQMNALINQIRESLPTAEEILSNEQVQAMIKDYIAEHPELVEEAVNAYIQKYIEENGGLTEAQIKKYLAQYLAENGMFDSKSIQKMLAKYMKGYGNNMQDLIKQYMEDYMKKMGANFDLSSLSKDQLQALMAQYSTNIPTTYDEVLNALHYYTIDEPSMISIYPIDFESKDYVVDFINEYNKGVKEEADKVTYSDFIKSITSSITDIINTITYILIAFVAISLVVSSIMIAIITYISVLERTKEIGVLRALGSTKNDISKIFNAETFIEGLISGVMGVVTTLLICIPVNRIVLEKMDVPNIAKLPPIAGVILILISVILTFIAGFLPSRIAAKKDPVTALRSE